MQTKPKCVTKNIKKETTYQWVYIRFILIFVIMYVHINYEDASTIRVIFFFYNLQDTSYGEGEGESGIL